MSSVIVEDGVLWYPKEFIAPPTYLTDPFYGLDQAYVAQLEQNYRAHCLSIKNHESLLQAYKTPMEYYRIEENKKSLKSWRGSPEWDHHAKLVRNSDYYKNIVQKEESSATKEFEKAIDEFAANLKKLVKDYQSGKLAISAMKNKSQRLFTDVYDKAYNYGRQASGAIALEGEHVPTTFHEDRWYQDAVRTEMKYWNNFLKQLEQHDGDFSTRRFSVDERLEMYIQSVTFMYHSGKISALPLNVLIYWYPDRRKFGNMCPGCRYMTDKSPFTRDNLPTVPRAGDTPCRMRCLHKLLIRHAYPSQVEARRKALPTKASMFKDLQRIMHGEKYANK